MANNWINRLDKFLILINKKLLPLIVQLKVFLHHQQLINVLFSVSCNSWFCLIINYKYIRHKSGSPIYFIESVSWNFTNRDLVLQIEHPWNPIHPKLSWILYYYAKSLVTLNILTHPYAYLPKSIQYPWGLPEPQGS